MSILIINLHYRLSHTPIISKYTRRERQQRHADRQKTDDDFINLNHSFEEPKKEGKTKGED